MKLQEPVICDFAHGITGSLSVKCLTFTECNEAASPYPAEICRLADFSLAVFF